MDKNTWENYPVGTYVLVTWEDDDRETYSVVRGKGDSGGASAGNVGIYCGSHWNEVFDWAGASFEVLYLPKEERVTGYPDEQDDVIRPGDLVRLVVDYSNAPAGSLGIVSDVKHDAYRATFPRLGKGFWVISDALQKVVEG